MDYEEENVTPASHLQELSGSDYEIKDGEPDVTGWNVFNRANVKIGEVDDLLFDPESRKVRYLVIQLQANGEDVADDKYVLVPIGVAQLDPQEDQVLLPVASAEELAGLPAYQSGWLNPEDEVQIRQTFQTGSTAPYEHPQFYLHEHFDEDHFYSRGNLPDNNTIIPAEDLDDAETRARALKATRIVDRTDRPDTGQPQA